MPELELGKIPNGFGAESSFIDLGMFLWGALIVGAAFFFFLGTFQRLRNAFQAGSRGSASFIWFFNLAVFVLGLSFITRSFKNKVVSGLLLILVLAGVFGIGSALTKKSGGEEENKKP